MGKLRDMVKSAVGWCVSGVTENPELWRLCALVGTLLVATFEGLLVRGGLLSAEGVAVGLAIGFTFVWFLPFLVRRR